MNDNTPENSPPVLAGDFFDDDATYVNELVQSEAEPPEDDELPRGSTGEPAAPHRVRNLLLATTGTYDQASSLPILALPPDPSRLALLVTNLGTAPLRIGGTQAAVTSPVTSYTIPVGTAEHALTGYTGAVWVASETGTVGTFSYTIGSVTS